MKKLLWSLFYISFLVVITGCSWYVYPDLSRDEPLASIDGCTLPQEPPWKQTESFNPNAVCTDHEALTLRKTWQGEPQIAYTAAGLDFNSQTGATLEARFRLYADNTSPFCLSLADETRYFLQLLIYPDRIERHSLHSMASLQTYHSQESELFTEMHVLKLEFQSRFFRLFLDGDSAAIMKGPIRERYRGAAACSVIVGAASSGTGRIDMDYVKVHRGLESYVSFDLSRW
ncbi:MAG: hypothetical protein JW828_02170 [Sedimentisphaerales bacterium]|nr:hypothetical protein [Sedimentisphaerales bacterium]